MDLRTCPSIQMHCLDTTGKKRLGNYSTLSIESFFLPLTGRHNYLYILNYSRGSALNKIWTHTHCNMAPTTRAILTLIRPQESRRVTPQAQSCRGYAVRTPQIEHHNETSKKINKASGPEHHISRCSINHKGKITPGKYTYANSDSYSSIDPRVMVQTHGIQRRAGCSWATMYISYCQYLDLVFALAYQGLELSNPKEPGHSTLRERRA